MANKKSAQKQARQNEKRRIINLTRRSSLKTAIKKVLTALKEGEAKDTTLQFLRNAESQLARAKGKGVIHYNTARRKISGLAKKVASAFTS